MGFIFLSEIEIPIEKIRRPISDKIMAVKAESVNEILLILSPIILESLERVKIFPKNSHFETSVTFCTQADGEHWRLKAELSWLKVLIDGYLDSYEEQNLIEFSHSNEILKTDVIFGIRQSSIIGEE